MLFLIEPSELRKALKDIEIAEKNGFKFCRGVFRLDTQSEILNNCLARYSDLDEKAHPTNPCLDWGRHQNVTKRHKFVKGKLHLIKKN